MNQDLWIIQEETRVFDIDMHLIWITEENLEDIEDKFSVSVGGSRKIEYQTQKICKSLF